MFSYQYLNQKLEIDENCYHDALGTDLFAGNEINRLY